MKQLEITYCNIEKGKYLSDIEPFKSDGIPSNSVIDKTLPALGATQGEIKFKRHSIITVANTPVIEGKQKKHPDILGVYQGIEIAHITAYLKGDITPKKIICTPEAYESKVKPAIEASEFDLYKDFFMLLDECERLITDVAYRAKIIAPIKDFFKFEKKAMISATVLPFSYKKFTQHGFKLVKILPQYEYKKPLKLINTNNIIASLRSILEKERTNPLFIFLNSPRTIRSIITILNTVSKSKVFCAYESAKELWRLGIDDADTTLGDFKMNNYLTSRFFSAVDIELEYKPDVVMITDVFMSRHSILDPVTESIQICGRFRNGIGEITHVTNFSATISSKSELAAREFLNGGYDAYKGILTGFNNAKNEGEKLTYKEALENSGISKFVDEEHELDDFMVDNFVHEERVKGFYKNSTDLIKAYEATGHFEIYPEKHLLPVSDEDNLVLMNARTQIEICKAVAKALNKYSQPYSPGTFSFFDMQTEINKLQSRYPEICNQFKELGYDGMEKCGFKKSEITNTIKTKKKQSDLYNPLLLKLIFNHFGCPGSYSESHIKATFSIFFSRLDINIKVTATLILKYFEADRSTGRGEKVYLLRSRKTCPPY